MSTASNGAERRGFITGGSWCVDRNKLIEFWPEEDSICEILSEERRNGGSGSNLAIDMKKLDPAMPVETIAIVGDDDDGRFLQAEADCYGIDRRQMTVSREAPTHYTECFGSKRSGRRTHMTFNGVGAHLSPDHFDFSTTRARIAHLGLPGVHRTMDAPWQSEANGWVAVLKKARAAGLLTNIELVSIEPARIAALARPCLPHLDLMVVNDHEIGAVAGEQTVTAQGTDVDACIRAMHMVMNQSTLIMVAVHFPKGGLALVRGGELVRQASLAVPKEEIVAANGAGDAFAAGFLYGFHEGWEPAECLALAHATAGASLRGISTSGTVEPWQTCLSLARRWGSREAI
ncbi:carbohydrate kinase family protein [Dongia sp.]|uniref:carbohydrate kinase family protein n=1 Tax=Dongia sp. TaxID=1977262 RepID=UPI003751E239